MSWRGWGEEFWISFRGVRRSFGCFWWFRVGGPGHRGRPFCLFLPPKRLGLDPRNPHDDTPRFEFKTPNPSLVAYPGKTGGAQKGSMTRGGRSGGSWGLDRASGGPLVVAVTRKGLNSTETHDDTGLQNPPRKKIPKKIFRGPTFFSRKKFFLVWGVSVIMGFLFKTKPVSSWVFEPEPNRRVIMGFPKPPVSHPRPQRSPPASLHDTLGTSRPATAPESPGPPFPSRHPGFDPPHDDTPGLV